MRLSPRWANSLLQRRHAILAAGAALFVACASSRGAPADLPPLQYTAPLTADSSRALILSALEATKLPVDGAPLPPGSNLVSSTFLVRRGGMGEAEIHLMLRLRTDPPTDSNAPSLSILEIDATARERNRMLTMSPEEARSSSMRRDLHPINANDRETIGRISAVLRALENGGFTREKLGAGSDPKRTV